jgi:phage terminase large subunit
MDDPNLSQIAHFQKKQELAWHTLLDPKTKYLLWGGSMAGGKSYLLRWAAVGLAMYYWGKHKIFGVPIGLFSEDYPTLKDRQISRMKREFPPWLGDLRDDAISGLSFKLKDKWGGGIILLRNLDDPAKYMSTEFAAIFVDELTRNNEQTFQDLRNRMRYPGIEDVKFLGVSNPGGIGHGWVRKLFVDRINNDPERDRFYYVHANVYDNKYVSETYIKQLESLPENKKKAYLYGSWDIFEGQVFTEFNRVIHVCNPFIPKEGLTLVGGMDWGYNAPTVLLLGVFKPQKLEGLTFNKLYIYKEIDGSEMTPRQWANVYHTHSDVAKAKIYGDPAMFNRLQDTSFSIADQFKREGLYISKSTNNRLNGITTIHNWLSLAPDGEPYMIVADNCRNLIKTIPEAMYDEHNTEDVAADWQDDHWYDALRYLTAMVKWVDAKSGAVTNRSRNIMIPKYQIVNDKGDYISLDPAKFGEMKGKPYYKP